MKRSFLLGGIAVFAISGCNNIGPGSAKLKSDDDKTLYAIGFDMGSKMKTLSPSKNEVAALKAGIDDALGKKESQVDIKKYTMMVGELIRTRVAKSAETEKKDSTAFLAKSEKAAGAEKTESGLIYVEKTAGTGASPKASDNVKVHYHGTLRDGTVFDSSKDRGEPATFRLDRVVKCWTEGVQKMKVGGKSELYCPSDLAYGDRGAPPKIPPGAALKFEVELIEIVKGDPAGAGAGAAAGAAAAAKTMKAKAAAAVKNVKPVEKEKVAAEISKKAAEAKAKAGAAVDSKAAEMEKKAAEMEEKTKVLNKANEK